MNMLIEIKLNWKENFFLLIFKVVILFFFILLVYLFLIFTEKISMQIQGNNEIYKNKEFFSLVDSFHGDIDGFSNFRSTEAGINIVENFYQRLNKEENFSFLSIFDQQIPIENFRGNNKFAFGYGTDLEVKSSYINELDGKEYINIKSVQINRKAFEYFNLNTRTQVPFHWETIDYANRRVPILLGSQYQGVYEIGDILLGQYYNLPFQFNVIGFLEKNTSIYYKGQLENYLDNTIIIPYPETKIEERDSNFRGILYFAMINGDIIIERTKTTDKAQQYVLERLATIGGETSFPHYTILGMTNFVSQYTKMNIVLTENRILMRTLFLLLLILIIFLCSGITGFIYEKRKNVYRNYFLSGMKKNKILKLVFIDIVLPYTLAGFVFLVSMICYKLMFINLILVVFGIEILILGISYLRVVLLFERDFV